MFISYRLGRVPSCQFSDHGFTVILEKQGSSIMMFSPYFLIIATAYLFIFVYFLLSNYKIIQAVCGEKCRKYAKKERRKYHIVPILKEAYVSI